MDYKKGEHSPSSSIQILSDDATINSNYAYGEQLQSNDQYNNIQHPAPSFANPFIHEQDDSYSDILEEEPDEDAYDSPERPSSTEEFISQDESNISAGSSFMFPYNRGHPLSKRHDSIMVDEFGHEYIVEGDSIASADEAIDYDALYASWTAETKAPILAIDIENIYIELAMKFGFQWDNMRNMFDYLMVMLDSRASRMTPQEALLTLHADYIGGPQSNFKKWYFACKMDQFDLKSGVLSFISRDPSTQVPYKDMSSCEALWISRMDELSNYERIEQLALYLLCWGEANNVRFMPECLCFIYKVAYDYLISPSFKEQKNPAPKDYFLDNCITPLYNLMHDQQYEIRDQKYVRKEKDHASIIGYDDINQMFWYSKGLKALLLSDGSRIMDADVASRYFLLADIQWQRVCYKSFRESRTWLHFLHNFSRIWILHISVFWYFTVYNSPTIYTPNFHYLEGTQPARAAKWCAPALAGAVASFISFLALILEAYFVPRNNPGAQPVIPRLIFVSILIALNIVPAAFIFGFSNATQQHYRSREIVGYVHFFFSIGCVAYQSFIPLPFLLGPRFKFRSSSRKYLANSYFTNDIASLPWGRTLLSAALWITVFIAKFVESYYFLTLSVRDPIRFLQRMKPYDCYDFMIGASLCSHQPKFLLSLVYLTDLVLFFLDTYLWYMLISTMFSIAYSFYMGSAIWTPWRVIFSNLPRRIYFTLLAYKDLSTEFKPKIYVGQIWNSIMISMYREHLLSLEHLKGLLYQQVGSEYFGKQTFQSPKFFMEAAKGLNKWDAFFRRNSEAERRISFFAQSLGGKIPDAVPVPKMPSFTVLIPHYGEKILLSLREIIREQDPMSRITLLEYLKQLYPNDWDNFVQDTKLMAGDVGVEETKSDVKSEKGKKQGTVKEDLPFYCIGFKSTAPEYTLRTRIWASLRSQTLYRTASGMMNYSRALKLLYRVEQPNLLDDCDGNFERLEHQLEQMAYRKFRLCISMQRYAKFNRDEYENAEFLLRAHPELQIAYLDQDPSEDGEEPKVYATLINGFCPFENGRRLPKYRIRLSGNPILGDGKADNQNMALPFVRGEYLQLIDANQDNYIEECMKIRNVLSEFEEMDCATLTPYTKKGNARHPVAMLGAREYVFSENSGILGDVAAGKEQTFGTLFSRSLALIGGKLHYGHPDFLNTIFMTTRGGVSKAQKGLHVNEDIYAGMTALQRGGRIKHCDYFQCGKGRDLGFGTIINFTTKIGTGMGEQSLSREYFYLGTQLPFFRMLSFYYAHAGFHLNNVFIMISMQLLMLVFVNLGAMYHTVEICDYQAGAAINASLYPPGCYMLKPVLDWIRRCIISIFIVFFISFLPLVVHDLLEKGVIRAVARLCKQIFSLSPMFEVFVTQNYANSIFTNLTYGGARYIATGRGLATTRVPFSVLYSLYTGSSIYLGSRLIMMLLFGTMTVWTTHYVYFWVTMFALVICPFIYNPHQFSFVDFFVDYREFLRWLSRGNTKGHAHSWIGFCRLARTRITGVNRKVKGSPSNKLTMDMPRAGLRNVIFTEVFLPACFAFFTICAYTFMNSQPGLEDKSRAVNGFIRIWIMAALPIAISTAALLILLMFSCMLGPLLRKCSKRYGAVLAALAHAVSVFGLVFTFEALWFLEAWSFSKTVLGCIVIFAIHRLVFKLVVVFLLPREVASGENNYSWWDGHWFGRKGIPYMPIQFIREFMCKVVEMNLFAMDFILSHCILFSLTPILCIPFIDIPHSVLLFWLHPSRQIRPPIYTRKQNQLRRRTFYRYSLLFFALLCTFVAMIVVPLVLDQKLSYQFKFENSVKFFRLMQPSLGVLPNTNKNTSE
ncbi:1,3-beta-glucan synthase component bgs3 [Schizosaccharomyces pombe]|uniref:1,3-beta-glucan synthase component bgs3 n=1 Tax=Schizosaccharomyces pombe (strain 972 / ATCC 24843) TaxID=284812 RepID=FKS3_SCHPO|nr:1,3-beta-glucan synthase subunit Bgs3 [Schizosaccharomyces pombe]Q9P377.1 RecName: Full=1,3-beta-glucan synthase component bgs3; AltName: Full=1,3-beta-D-glucan-UDP glucosyltransferase [Schizosaccharomyces pombe 972h-]CAC00551.1 1,3-beta-glucan synthase subunit Bgs3 [Schizosaccharomyces pombe]CAC69670.1 beta 1,3 glucan synthase [Schizosaccharomyces pombe]|eukprot:NP_594766.1 1,3-beta-glucan synthase subunit Bgs3 [Schizosaccharomyces pombe]